MTEIKASFAPVTNGNTTVLVLGSLPGDRSLAEQRYYAHPQNQFWTLMSRVTDVDLCVLEYEARLAALLVAGVGLWDVVGVAVRTGSTDAAIRDVSANDLTGLIQSLPMLRAIGFNGGTALSIGRRQLGAAANSLAIVALPSSSPLHTVGAAAKQPAWNELRKYLG
ncbi:DNA-deoxyinosine glycosylase [Sphingomonas paeninsulae]|jgi:hypoxanthine-DNA glycosylase|uniref:DNA-deoxyinosine glycosylase n=1 Tax=Sphingomonas paeninsulae TaxID=2319844 RepID=A0A494THK6_SPHPE|nr:DNA-deoxyinosine glycosylase [Sphingomonas paeninsulae]AYJ86802.1 DNA-deoxyinosine glycosylase [Sphingomonas paeninsulae]